MQFGDNRLNHVFEPLKKVDVKTLAAIAISLKNSRNKNKRAVGVFLDRINRYRTGGQTPANTSADTSHIDNTTGLRDLLE